MEHSDPPPLWGVASAPDELGRLVALLRSRHSLSQGALAEQAGVPRRFVNELEGGHATIYGRRLFAVLSALDAHLVVEEQRGSTHRTDAVGGRRNPGSSPDGESTLKDLGW